MEKANQVGGSSSSFTTDLFGPKETSKSSSSSTGLFGSVFGPPSTGLGKGSSHSGRTQHYGSQYDNVKNGTSEYVNQKSREDGKDRGTVYQTETAEPCYFSSSIYYGGQEVYSPTGQGTNTRHVNQFRKDGGDDDPNGNNSTSASRGNWWQGSLYY